MESKVKTIFRTWRKISLILIIIFSIIVWTFAIYSVLVTGYVEGKEGCEYLKEGYSDAYCVQSYPKHLTTVFPKLPLVIFLPFILIMEAVRSATIPTILVLAILISPWAVYPFIKSDSDPNKTPTI